jgi:3'(2'), 5'-bisphosphate nucleotidase
VSDKVQLTDILETMLVVAQEAGDLALHHFHSGCDRTTKADGSIVTIADTQAEALIAGRLKAFHPDVGFLGEESIAAGHQPDLSGPYFCVDPIDGTKQFASGNPHWVVALAYVEDGRPLAGVIYAPAFGKRLFAGLADHGGFEVLLDGTRRAFPQPGQKPTMWRVLHGIHDKEAAIKTLLPAGLNQTLGIVGSGLKFGLVAAGEADLWVRAGSVWDWDIAAGQAILEAAGGRVVDTHNKALVYGRGAADFRHPPFLAMGATYANQ